MPELSDPLKRFRLFLRSRSASHHTLRNYLLDAAQLERHLTANGLDLVTARPADIDEYLGELSERLAPTSQARHIATLKQLYRLLVRERLVGTSPVAHAKRPQHARIATRVVPEVRQVFEVLEQPPRNTVLGLRDRAMLELLYGAGVRVAELAGMDLLSVEPGARMLRVMGKGGRERLCPINAHALKVLEEYLAQRHKLASSRSQQHPTALFLGEWGRRLTTYQIWRRVKAAAAQAGLNLSPHSFRHAYATHMLHRGAPVQDLQELLGHLDLDTTQLYTHVSEDFIRREYQAHHPRALSSSRGNSAARTGARRRPSARTQSTAAGPSRRRADPAHTATCGASRKPSFAAVQTRRVQFSR